MAVDSDTPAPPDGGDGGASSDRNFALGVGAGALALFAVGLFLRFDDVPTLPAKPPPPPAPDQRALRRMDYENPEIYKGYLEADSSLYQVARTTPDDMRMPFPYEASEAPRRLTAGDTIDTAMLQISLVDRKLEMRTRNGKSGAHHLVLRIENKRPKPVAFRVVTSVGGLEEACSAKAVLDHNAIVLPAGGNVERTECTARDGLGIQVERVESMEVPELSYFYLSRLPPTHIGLSTRASAGHRVPRGEVCPAVPQQLILIGMEKGTVSWRDVVDYYARHRCETYGFPVGYRAFTKAGQYDLPVSAATVGDGPR
jgi:hypothetical protein